MAHWSGGSSFVWQDDRLRKDGVCMAENRVKMRTLTYCSVLEIWANLPTPSKQDIKEWISQGLKMWASDKKVFVINAWNLLQKADAVMFLILKAPGSLTVETPYVGPSLQII